MTAETRAVLFDLDDTLCAYRRHGETVLSTAFERLDVPPFFEIGEYYERYAAFAAGAGSEREIGGRCFESIAADHGREPALGRALADVYADERDHGNVRPLPGVPGVLDEIGSRAALGLVTNGTPAAGRRKLAAVGAADAFDAVVNAGHDTVDGRRLPTKPEPDAFYAALDELGVAPDRAVHVGNDPSTDVRGARAAGLETVLVGGETGGPEPDRRVASVAELGAESTTGGMGAAD